MKAVGRHVGGVLAPTRTPGFCRVRASTHPTGLRVGKPAMGVLCLASIVLLARGGSAAGADLRKAVRALLPATVAVEWRSVDSESARRTEVFPLKHSKAEAVAEVVKEVYRDLLKDSDKSPRGRNQRRQKSDGRYGYTYIYGDELDGEREAPKGKGSLSIGVDATSNTLIVSAPDSLLREIGRLIEQLDQAAKAAPEIAVEKLPRNQARSWATIRGKGTVVVADQLGYRPDAVVLASGTVVSSDGLIVTLLGETGEGSHSVTFPDGRTMSAKLLVDDRRCGLRLLKVDAEDLAHVELADKEAELGQQVVAVCATDPKSRVVAQGIIAASGRALPGLAAAVLQSDLQVGAMSAGAPLGDVNGKLVGIIAAMQAKDPTQQGPAYAVPADYVKRLMDARQDDKSVVVQRGHLGVGIHDPSGPGGGVRVREVIPDSPAAEVGIQEGDQLVAVDGQPVSAPAEVVRLIGRHKPGDRVTIVIRRDDEEQKLEVTLGRFDRKPQTAASSPPQIEAVEPQTLHILDKDGKVKRVTIYAPKDGEIIEFPPEVKPVPFDPENQQGLIVEVPPAPATIRVQRSDVEKKLDQLNRDVQLLKDHIQVLTEEVQKLREEMAKESGGEK